jgi:hypothetical protein
MTKTAALGVIGQLTITMQAELPFTASMNFWETQRRFA